MKKLEQLLAEAIERYGRVMEIFSRLEDPIDQDQGDLLNQQVLLLEENQQEASLLDQSIKKYLDGSSASLESLPLMREYRALVASVKEKNAELLEKARVHQAMIASELAEIRGNKNAISGYRTTSDSRGQRLSGNF